MSQSIIDVRNTMRKHLDIIGKHLNGRTKMSKFTLKDIKTEMDCSIGVLNDLIGDEVEMLYRNYYRCPICKEEWQDEWDSMCNDKCPKCDSEIEPYKSEAIGEGE